jgi:EAL domain-containing protein (putative c-di-GMP-specific phosphodiesterase class I)/two-component sensor histidine kinase
VGSVLGDMCPATSRLDRAVEFASRHLQLDVVYVSELRDGRQLYCAVAGDGSSFNIAVGDGAPAKATLDQLMLEGQIPSVIRDVSADPRAAGLAVTRAARIGAFVGVPLRCPDGTLYGTISAVSHSPLPTLDEGAERLLSLLGELIIHDVCEQRARGEQRGNILELIESSTFDLAYQPLFDLDTDRCIGLEALTRFPEPFITPDQAFSAAAEVGLGIELERVTALQACEIVPRLGAGQFLSVNASPAALLRLAQRRDAGEVFPLARIVVELTEHSITHAYGALRDQLAPLREQGLRIAVDDAGAGYASLRHILELRPDFIKLDRWLIDGLADDRGRRVAVSAFVSLARELGSIVVAEGVERPADLRAVRDLGLDGAQGYLLGGPSSAPALVAGWCAGRTGGVSALARSGALLPGQSANGERLRGDAELTDCSLALAGCGNGVQAQLSPRAERVAGTGARDRGALGHELERLELDRRVSHRLEVVGQLAAGIAHEINTPLQFVGDSVTFLKEAVDELVGLTASYREALYTEAPIRLSERRLAMREAEERADLEYLCERIPAAFARTADGITRVRSIVQAMKSFSHASSREAAPADINEAIETTLVVCRNEYKYVANVALDLGELPAVICNVGELNQVFLNLIVNAAQAIEEKVADSGEQGKITISTRVEQDTVLIEITDDGPGIPRALWDRIYEPFFTTKEVGKGTGQGLALARATIERHAGSLVCDSEPGEGTTFTIRLPLPRATDEPAKAA